VSNLLQEDFMGVKEDGPRKVEDLPWSDADVQVDLFQSCLQMATT
jgi:hypothetical protein